MLYRVTQSDGRTATFSDEYYIRQLDTGRVYESAVDTVPHDYEETDIPLPDPELSDADALAIITGGAVNEAE